jgi:hypothetical protein
MPEATAESTYKPTGYFGNRGIGFYSQFVNKSGVLEVERVKETMKLTEDEIPLLIMELQHAGILPEPDENTAIEDLKKPALITLAQSKHVEVPKKATKAEIKEAIEEAEQ